MNDEQDLEQEESDEEGEEEGSDTELEQEFKKACEKALPKIEEQIEIARKAIAKAEKISEKYGVPFESDITPLSMAYTPCSFYERFRKLDSETIYDFAGAYPDEYEGWEHSAVGC
jgi:hypothetical protein